METLRPGQTFSEAVAQHLGDKERQRFSVLQKQLAPLKEEYRKNSKLLETLGIIEQFNKAAESIKQNTGREAKVYVSAEPEIVTNPNSPKYKRLNVERGDCTITLTWKDSIDAEDKREEKHEIKVVASDGIVDVGIGAFCSRFQRFNVTRDISYADLLARQEQKEHLREDSRQILNEMLFDAYLEAERGSNAKVIAREEKTLVLV